MGNKVRVTWKSARISPVRLMNSVFGTYPAMITFTVNVPLTNVSVYSPLISVLTDRPAVGPPATAIVAFGSELPELRSVTLPCTVATVVTALGASVEVKGPLHPCIASPIAMNPQSERVD